MCLSDCSYCELIGLASSLAIYISKDLSGEELGILATFVTALGDNLAIAASKKDIEELKNPIKKEDENCL